MLFKPYIFPAVLLLVISATALTLIYVLMKAPTQWGGENQVISGSSFNLPRGVGRAEGDALLIQETGSDGIAIAAYQAYGVKAQDFPRLTFDVTSAAPLPEVLLLFRTADNPGAAVTRRLQWQGNRVADLSMTEDPEWQGEINGLALVIRGSLPAPFTLRSITLHPNNIASALTGLTAGWLQFEPWHGGSINFIYGGDPNSPVPLITALTLLVLLAGLFYWAWTKWRHKVFKPGVIAALVVLAWLVLDFRWQVNLGTQLAQTGERYAGKKWADKHRAAEDGDLFEFAQAVKAKLGPAPARVMIFSDFDYFRGRGAYHLYPHNVFYKIKDASLPPIEAIHRGEYLVFYQKRGIQYHPGKKELLWNGKPLLVEPILLSKGNAFFKVR